MNNAILTADSSSLGRADKSATRIRYEAAVNALVEKLRADRLLLAVILCGSLAHDEVWEKSDVDLILVTTDDLKESKGYTLVEDDINIHASLMSRSKFKAVVQGSLQGSFFHSLLSKGKLIYTSDDSMVELCRSLGHLGGRDREISMLRAVCMVFLPLTKAEKWLYAKHDPTYCFFWIMKLVDGLAHLELLYHGEIPGREVIQQALVYNPELFKALYGDLIEGPKTVPVMENALRLIREYLLQHSESFAPLLDYLNEAGGPRTVSEISHHFERQMRLEFVDMALEWLAEQGVVQKLSSPCRLLPKSRASVEEACYFYEAP